MKKSEWNLKICRKQAYKLREENIDKIATQRIRTRGRKLFVGQKQSEESEFEFTKCFKCMGQSN